MKLATMKNIVQEPNSPVKSTVAMAATMKTGEDRHC